MIKNNVEVILRSNRDVRCSKCQSAAEKHCGSCATFFCGICSHKCRNVTRAKKASGKTRHEKQFVGIRDSIEVVEDVNSNVLGFHKTFLDALQRYKDQSAFLSKLKVQNTTVKDNSLKKIDEETL